MKYLWYILAVAVLLLALGLFFQVNEVTAEGNTRYESDEIVAASGLRPGGSLILFGKSEAENRVLERFPFVENVKIKRRFPDTLVISVSESVPLARITLSDGRVALIERSGKVVDITGSSSEGLLVRGITPVSCNPGEPYTAISETEAEALDYALEIIETLLTCNLDGEVSYLAASVLNPSFGYGEEFTVELGKRENTAEKIKLFSRHLPHYERGDKATIDLSIPGETHYIPN